MRRGISFIILFSVVGLVYSQDLTLARVVQQMKEAHPLYQAQLAQREVNRALYKEEGAAFYPSIGFDGPASYSYTDTGDLKNLKAAGEVTVNQLLPTAGILSLWARESLEKESASYLAAEEETYLFSTGITLTQPLYWGKAYQAAREGLEEGYELRMLQSQQEEGRIIIQGAADYYQLKNDAYRFQLIQDRYISSGEDLIQKEKELELGIITPSELSQAQINYLQSEIDLLQIRQVKEAHEELFFRTYRMEAQEVSPEVDLLPWEEGGNSDLVEELLAGSPALQISRLQASRLKHQHIREEQGEAPVLALSGNYWSQEESSGYTLSLNLEADLWSGGAKKGARQGREAAQEEGLARLGQQEIQLINQLQRLVSQVESQKDLDRLYSLQSDLAREEVNKGEANLALGMITERELFELKIAYEQAKLQIQENRIQLNKNIIALHNLLGRDLYLLAQGE